MTELNPAPETEPAVESPPGAPTGTVEARVDWPMLPARAAGRDPEVEALLERLGTLPGLPVSDHAEVYAGLHADLMEALNEAGDTAP